MSSTIGAALIDALLTDPDVFNNQGRGYQLLQCFLTGEPVSHLHRLLTSTNPQVVRTAIWIASELGKSAHVLLDDIKALLVHKDTYVRYYALDTLVLASPQLSNYVKAMTNALADSDQVLRVHAMELMARADSERWVAVVNHVDELQNQGLKLTCNGRDGRVIQSNALLAKVQAIDSVRRHNSMSAELEHLGEADKSDIEKFLSRALSH